jgi:hypothetical protein
MTIKKHHILGTVLAVVGALFVFHMWKSHGTFSSSLSNLGINR